MSPERILSKLGVTDVTTVSDNDTVERALEIINNKKLRSAPVVDSQGVFKGMFSAQEIIKNLVPSYIADGMQSLDFAAGFSPILASRLKAMYPSRVGDHVSSEDSCKIYSKTHTWEALRMLTKYGSPLPIVDQQGFFKGLISEQSAIEALLNMDIDDEDDNHNQ